MTVTTTVSERRLSNARKLVEREYAEYEVTWRTEQYERQTRYIAYIDTGERVDSFDVWSDGRIRWM